MAAEGVRDERMRRTGAETPKGNAMSTVAKVTLMFVVFVDLIGQGLVFPIVNSLIMEPSSDFLPKGTAMGTRHFDYGLVIGMFFLAWFLGVVYVSKVSDSIGRKSALLICLGGALTGYAITLVSLYANSLWLLILGRAVTGFTAGNQPIAQAAMIDGSTDAADRDRNMGFVVTVYSFFMISNVTFYVFIDNYLTSAFGYGVIGGSVAMLVIGVALASSSTFLVKPVQRRVDKRRIVGASLLVMVICAMAFALIPVAVVALVPVFFFYLLFGVSYPTLLGLFSSTVSEADQGWVMGVTTAVFCLAGGIMSLIGGELMGFGIRSPFYVAALSAAVGLLLMGVTWRATAVRKLTARPAES